MDGKMTGQDGEDVNDLKGFVSSSTHRQKIMAVLTDGSRTASQLADEAGMYRSHVSNSLRGLEDKGLVRCTTPDRRKGKLFALTERGREAMEDVPIPSQYFPKVLESRVAELLDEMSVPYARNVEFDVRGTKVVPDFVVVEGFEPKLVVETKIAYPSTDISGPLERLAFRIAELKKEIEGLKAVLVLGGMEKEDWAETRVFSFVGSDYFDAVIHEDDFDRIRKEKPSLEELLNDKYFEKWSGGELAQS